ncbi:class I SAM-dependent methyltransferase [Streptomyces sp. NPDC054796]
MDDRTTHAHAHAPATTAPARFPAQRNTESWTFLTEAVRDFRTTGAIAPSSRRLAGLLTDGLRERTGRPLTVLEAGAGTGSVTRTLIPLLGRECHLDIVEANERFAARLRHLVHGHPHLSDRPGGAGRVRVHPTLVEELDTGRRYDVIVSGLPFANLEPDQVETIMDRYLELLRPGGTLAYFAYLGTGAARTLLAPRAEAARHREVESVLERYQRRYATGCWKVWGNLPPAKVWQLSSPRTPAAPAPAAAATV